MVRSLIIIALAIVCGAAAAIGVNQTLREQSQPVAADVDTHTVVVAAVPVRRGATLTQEMIREVQWPVVPGVWDPESGVTDPVIDSADGALNRVALTALVAGEPVFESKLTDETGQGFIASVIKPGMRAKTIETRGPSASVAGFVRPGDRVDVLLNIRGRSGDETGGSSTITLLQSVELLAIDQVLDPGVDAIEMLGRWAKGDEPTSVTLQVKPSEALLLDLGQSYGELSLSLRGFGDEEEVETLPATIKDIATLERFLTMNEELATSDGQSIPPDERRSVGVSERFEAPPVTYIQTYRGSVSGRIDLVRRVIAGERSGP